MEDNLTYTISDICRKKKEDLHYTYKDIADATGIPEITIIRFLSANPPKSPSVYTVCPICAFLGVSIDEIFEIPIDKDPRSEELVAQLRTELDKRADYIHRLQETVTEKNGVIEEQASTIKNQTDLIKKAHDTSRKLVVAVLCLTILCIIVGAYGLTMDHLVPMFGLFQGG